MKSKLTRLITVVSMAISLILAAASAYAVPSRGSVRSDVGGGSRSGVIRRQTSNMPVQRSLRGGRDLRGSDRFRGDRDRKFRGSYRHRPGLRHQYRSYRYYRPHTFFFGYGPFCRSGPFGYWNYGYGYRDYGFGYGYGYRPSEPSRPVWTPPAPVKLSEDITTQWMDPVALRVKWTGNPAPANAVEMALLSSEKTVLRRQITRSAPYTLTMDVPETARYLRIRTYNPVGATLLYEKIVPLPTK